MRSNCGANIFKAEHIREHIKVRKEREREKERREGEREKK